MLNIEISEQTDRRLKAIAQPLSDTYDTVIQRLLDLCESPPHHSVDGPPGLGLPIRDDGRIMEFSWINPPSLVHTTITSVNLNGANFVKADTYWNAVLARAIEAASKSGLSKTEIYNFLSINKHLGEKSTNGFKYLPTVGISFQNQDSNNAFRQIFLLAEHCNFKLRIQFRWQNKDDAAYPNREGSISI